MNVFENVEFLCGNVKGCNDLINRFLDVSNDIKDSLGEKSKLLDEYLMVVFEAINSIDILSATNMADNLCADVLHSCRCVLKNQPVIKQRRFYKETKQYIETHNFKSINFETKVYFYAANVLIDNIENMIKIFARENKNKILILSKYENINLKYKEITGLIDERKIDLLNSLLDEAFIMCPINTIFVQALMLKIVEFIIYQDTESKRSIFKLIIDNKNNN